MLLTFGRYAVASCRWCWQLQLLLQIVMFLSISEALYGDPCSMKSLNGVCTLSSKCESLQLLIERGDFSASEIVSCGFDLHEEIICCPSDKPTDPNMPQPTPTPKNPVFIFEELTSTTTTARTKDFWEDLLTTVPPSTTTERDFWLDLLTTSTTTTTTTPKPLLLGDKELDHNSEFYDFSQLLGGNSKDKMSPTNTLPKTQARPNPPTDNSFNNLSPNILRPNQINPPQVGGFVQQMPVQPNQPTGSLNFPQNNQRPFRPEQPNGVGDFSASNNGVNFRPSASNIIRNVGRGIRDHLSASHTLLRGQQRGRSGGPIWQNGFDEQAAVATQNNEAIWNNGNGNGHGNGRGNGHGRGLALGHINNGRRSSALQWLPNRDVQVVNPSSSHIWPNQPQPAEARELMEPQGNPQAWFQNAPTHESFSRPADDMDTASSSIHSQHVQPSNQWSTLQEPSHGVQPQVDPIASVNKNLIENGMDVVKAQLTNFERGGERDQQQLASPQTAVIPVATDPFAPFQFRPPQEIDTINNDIETDWPKWVNNGGVTPSTVFVPSTFFTDSSSSSKKPTETGNSTSTPTSGTAPTTVPRLNERPSVKACRLIDEGLEPLITPHILDGTPVELGEYPHMVAIGFTTIGNDAGPYDFRCGGALIEKRFVLTAAHCVTDRVIQPAIVRMGVTNFTDEEQMREVVEVRVQRLHIHPNYTNSRKYNDIALLELERDVPYSANVYPCCLYTELEDPPNSFKFFVTGWGTINTRTREVSNQLLKARLELTSVANCNESYALEGSNRQLALGVIDTQMCAFDPGLTKDACQGDSGGPLNMVLDESLKKYRILGVISAGFSCGTRTPGLYTRVAAFIDYIESVVWSDAN